MSVLALLCFTALAHAQQTFLISPQTLRDSCASLRASIASQSIHHLSPECLASLDTAALDAGSVIYTQDSERLLHVQRASVDPAVFGWDSDEPTVWLKVVTSAVEQGHARLLERQSALREGTQHVLASSQAQTQSLQLLKTFEPTTSLLYSVPTSLLPELDLFFPALAELTLIPQHPTTSAAVNDSRLLSHFPVQYSSTINKLATHLSLELIKADVRYISGEADNSDIRSRHSLTDDARKVAHWLKDQYEQTGGQCRLHWFSEGFSPNVVCFYKSAGSSNETVVLGAHYDSRGSFGYVRGMHFWVV